MGIKLKRPKAIICDIEGTTTSTKYWGEMLVPFIKYNTQKCLKERWDVPILMELIDNLRKSTELANKAQKGAGIPAIAAEDKPKNLIIQSVLDNVIEQTNSKRHGKALQHFQMYVWLFGYQTEELKGHVFPDVSKALNNWQKFNNINIYTFASGVYLTQKMLFACSIKGNLTPLITDYLDVESFGLKTEGQSFKNISKHIGIKTENILFLSDNPKELTAAQSVNCQVLLVIRPQNPELPEEVVKKFTVIKSFDKIHFV